MSETYVILIAEDSYGSLKTALVEKESYEEDPDPESYFKSGMVNVKKEGEVNITGDVHLLPTWISQD